MPDMKILLSSINFVADNDDNIIRTYTAKGFKPWKLYFGLMPPHPGSFLRSEVYKKVGTFNPSYSITGDFDLFVRAFIVKRIAYIIIPLVSVTMSTGGVSTSGLKSYRYITQEFAHSLSENGLFSSWLLISIRAIFKFPQFRLLNFVRSKLF